MFSSADSLEEARYASGAKLVLDALQAFIPAARTSVADYTAQHRWLANEGGGHVGRWRHETTPYLVEPMECLNNRAHDTVAIVGPGQSAKTTVGENWLLQSIAADPGDLLWYMQTEPALESYVKRRIDPMIALHEEMKSRLGTRSIDDSLHFKRFDAMAIEFLAATHSNLISKSAPRIVVDEVDAYPKELGDILALVNIRRQSFKDGSMVLGVSHPDRAGGMSPRKWNDGIMAWYAGSDCRTWWCPCPHCGCWASFNPTAPRQFTLEYSADAPLDVIEQAARLACPSNGCLITDTERLAMLVHGRWVGLGQAIDEEGNVEGEMARRSTAGFWITGIMSPFAFGGIGGLAAARVKAEREFQQTGDDASLRQVIVKQWGWPYDAAGAVGTLDANTLAERAEPFPLGIVPAGVRFITVFVDVQINRFEVLAVGWGESGESWVIDHKRIAAEPTISPDDWDALLTATLDAEYPLADGGGRIMRVRGVGVDAFGAPGTTEQAYALWRRARGRRRIRKLGQIGGRDVWNFLPCKGMPGINANRLAVAYPDTARKDRKAAARGEIPLGQFNANQFKDALWGRLGKGESGPGYVHFPDALKSPEPPHLWFEQIVAEIRKPSGAWEAIAPRNEALDLLVGTHVIAHLHGLARLDWTRPPPWAAPWDANSAVGQPASRNTPAEPLRPGPAAPFAKAPPASAPAAFNPAVRRAESRYA